jgi:probable selenium-dependent hydroxylase accessory protein YqeC
MDAAELVLLEADGSKRLPLKVPADREPVLLPESDILIAVCGLRSLGAPLEQICFRLEQAQELLGKLPAAVVTEEDLVRILTSERGGRKGAGNREYYMVLNQCDDAERLRAAGRIAEHILHKTGEKTIATCLKS